MILSHLCTREAPLLSIIRRELALSSGLVKRLKWQDALLLNGVPVHTNARVRPGDRVTVDLSETVVGYEGEDVPLNILYEDDCCLAVDKPRGMLVHPSPRRNSGTLANAVLGYYQRTGQACGVHPVTRLDRDTFGVVLFAKNAYIHEKFCEMQKKHQISKTYHASVYGTKMADFGLIDLPILKLPGRSLLRTVAPNGKKCRTLFAVLARFQDVSVLELKPVTGRTHQLTYNDTFRAIDYESTRLRHERKVTHEDLMFVNLICFFIIKANPDIQRRRICCITLFALFNCILHLVFAKCKINKFQTQMTTVVRNRGNIVKYLF